MHYWLQESLLCAEHIFLQQFAGLSAFPSQPIFRCTADNALLAIGKTAHFTRTTNKPPILLCEPVLKGHVGTKSALTHTKKKKARGLWNRFAEQKELLVALLVRVTPVPLYICCFENI